MFVSQNSFSPVVCAHQVDHPWRFIVLAFSVRESLNDLCFEHSAIKTQVLGTQMGRKSCFAGRMWQNCGDQHYSPITCSKRSK